MNPTTIVIRLPLANATTEGITAVCDNHWAAGYRLASSFLAADELILIFQPR